MSINFTESNKKSYFSFRGKSYFTSMQKTEIKKINYYISKKENGYIVSSSDISKNIENMIIELDYIPTVTINGYICEHNNIIVYTNPFSYKDIYPKKNCDCSIYGKTETQIGSYYLFFTEFNKKVFEYIIGLDRTQETLKYIKNGCDWTYKYIVDNIKI